MTHSPETSSALTAPSMVDRLKEVLAPFGQDHVLEGLESDADELRLMSRLIEMGPTSDGSKDPSRSEFKAFIAAASLMKGGHRLALLEKVREHAIDPQSPYRRMAIDLLAPVDPITRKLQEQLAEEDKKALTGGVRASVQMVCANTLEKY